jgi:tetratricopeptide (TPR) repeat protein
MGTENKKKTGVIMISAILWASSVILLSQSANPAPPPPPPAPAVVAHASKADSLLMAGRIQSALTEYRKMYSQNRTNRNIIYNYACALSLAGQADSSLVYLYKAMKIDPSISILTDPDLLAVRESKGWEEFENELISAVNKKTGNSIKDVSYAKSLWKLLCQEESLFYEVGIAVKNLGPDSPVVTALRRLQSWQNAKSLAELEGLLDAKGWPAKSQVGSVAASAAFYVLQHSNAGAQEKYVGMFEAACRNNEGNWQQYALMFDRMRMNQNKPQRYGTHTYLDPGKGRTDELYPLEDETRVDEWRKEIGLEPLKDYLFRTGIKK